MQISNPCDVWISSQELHNVQENTKDISDVIDQCYTARLNVAVLPLLMMGARF
jgi:hypothetical protein